MNAALRAVGLTCCLAGAACGSYQENLSDVAGSPTAVARLARLNAAIADPDTAGRATPIAQWLLPQALQEISGLALTSDGRMLVHNDEFSRVWEVDYRSGVLVKRFSLGNGALAADFEGIAIADSAVFLITSKGILYEFTEGANDAKVAYQVHDTGLNKECEFEGVAFDPAINTLLLACKDIVDKEVRNAVVIYRWSLTGDISARLSRLTVPLDAAVLATNGWKNLHPSDITVDPVTGNYILLASLEKALITITPAGVFVSAVPLPAAHQMAEGVAVTKDGILIISDEAGDTRAAITLYRWR